MSASCGASSDSSSVNHLGERFGDVVFEIYGMDGGIVGFDSSRYIKDSRYKRIFVMKKDKVFNDQCPI